MLLQLALLKRTAWQEERIFKGALCLPVALIVLTMFGCGLPDSPPIPDAPISIDNNDNDNTLSFAAPADSKIDRYIIWYKIYPYLTRTQTTDLVSADNRYFDDLNTRSASDIRKRGFHELRLSANPDSGYYFQGLESGERAFIMRNPDTATDTANYITVRIGDEVHNVRRNVATSAVDNSRKPFRRKFSLDDDADLRSRRSSFQNTGEGFAVAFLAQSAYVDSAELEFVHSELTALGTMYSPDGFSND